MHRANVICTKTHTYKVAWHCFIKAISLKLVSANVIISMQRCIFLTQRDTLSCIFLFFSKYFFCTFRETKIILSCMYTCIIFQHPLRQSIYMYVHKKNNKINWRNFVYYPVTSPCFHTCITLLCMYVCISIDVCVKEKYTKGPTKNTWRCANAISSYILIKTQLYYIIIRLKNKTFFFVENMKKRIFGKGVHILWKKLWSYFSKEKIMNGMKKYFKVLSFRWGSN